MKDTLTETKNNLQGINSKMDETKNQISNLEFGSNLEESKKQSEQQEEKRI